MIVYGKLHSVDRKNRMISIEQNGKINYYHLTNKNMKDFKNYLYRLPYVSFVTNNKLKYKQNIKCYQVEHFIRIHEPRNSKDYYNLNTIQNGVKKMLEGIKNKMFLDLEFSLVGSGHYVSEIVQYGILVENEKGEKLYEGASLVKPLYHTSINKKTLNFLSIKAKKFDDACSYIEFYQLLQELITKYNPKIIAWGRNDLLSLEKSFKLNHLRSLDIRKRYLNLMKLMKTYYQYKQEKGLFNTYKEMANITTLKQKHDALEDALIEREIYYLFKANIERPENHNQY